MPKREDHETAAAAPGVVEWNPPAKRELVEHDLSDAMTDPTKIVEWAKNRPRPCGTSPNDWCPAPAADSRGATAT